MIRDAFLVIQKCIEDDGKSNKKTDKIVESQVF